MSKIVTKEWLAAKVAADPSRVIGRALLAIYNNQTEIEQSLTATTFRNGRGFTKPDARIGSIGARMFKSKQHLDAWLITIWQKPAKDGYPRICKYVEQLNTIATVNQIRKINSALIPVLRTIDKINTNIYGTLPTS